MDYRYKLEALRQYRIFQEEACQKEMAEAQRIRDDEADKLARLLDLRRKTEIDLKSKQQENATGQHLAMYCNYLNKLTSDIFSQRHQLSNAESKLEAAREALTAAIQRRKTLDKLKEKGFRAHIENLNSEEQKFINEMAINRFTFKQR